MNAFSAGMLADRAELQNPGSFRKAGSRDLQGLWMRLIVAVVLFVSICALGGCAQYWYQEDKSFDQTRHDLAACQAEAVRYSDVGRTHGLGGFEKDFVERCMQEQGYRLVHEKELPIRVRRESSPVFGLPGVAGTID